MMPRQKPPKAPAGGGSWTPPASVDMWWYGNNLDGAKWDDQIAAYDATLGGDASIGADGLTLDGSGDYAQADNTGAYAPSAITLCAWIRPGVVTGYQHIVGRDGGRSLYLSNNKCACVIPGKTIAATGSTPLLAGVWHHVAVTYAETNGYRVWLNGTDDTASAPGGSPAPTGLLQIGRRYAGSSEFTGKIDDAMAAGAALLQSDIQDIRANSPGSHA